jgi:hypothetical protein
MWTTFSRKSPPSRRSSIISSRPMAEVECTSFLSLFLNPLFFPLPLPLPELPTDSSSDRSSSGVDAPLAYEANRPRLLLASLSDVVISRCVADVLDPSDPVATKSRAKERQNLVRTGHEDEKHHRT